MAGVYRALIRTALAVQVQYRASGVIWMLGHVLEPVVFLSVWSAVARSQGGSIGGYTPEEFAAYYLVLMVVNHLTFSWIMHEFQFRIQQGWFSFLLLRPLHPIHGDLADNVAYKLVMLVALLPAVLLLALVFRPHFEPRAWSLLAALPALLLAFGVRFLFEWVLALAAFWTTRTSAVNQIYFALLVFLSGRVAPIALLPEWLRDASALLPFRFMVAFPVEVALGRRAPAEVAVGLAAQLGWLLLALGVLGASWRVAVRRFSAVGS